MRTKYQETHLTSFTQKNRFLPSACGADCEWGPAPEPGPQSGAEGAADHSTFSGLETPKPINTSGMNTLSSSTHNITGVPSTPSPRPSGKPPSPLFSRNGFNTYGFIAPSHMLSLASQKPHVFIMRTALESCDRCAGEEGSQSPTALKMRALTPSQLITWSRHTTLNRRGEIKLIKVGMGNCLLGA